MKAFARFFFEAGMLKKMRRTGYPFLGSGGESIADHCFRAALLGFHLAMQENGVDASRVALLILHHDLAEARTGDFNYVHKQYNTADEDRAIMDQVRDLPERHAELVRELTDEFNQAETPEALIAHDADQLDLLLELKEQMDLGNPYAKHWIHYALKRIRGEKASELARAIMDTDWTDWWFEKKEELWVLNGHDADHKPGS